MGIEVDLLWKEGRSYEVAVKNKDQTKGKGKAVYRAVYGANANAMNPKSNTNDFVWV